ncbi:hypothetical protein ONS95_001915 [Cadophora gregata]|nr:uncharacterized protein ONS95_001915 [Cadophora gregata]KAK0111564.1 hypothetical protein ONS95_001915 [Cadophora gregata]KAK0111961.1 hypothetical protein ONS96_001223 [Cadophora gregata f. sp. sojae]
MSRGNTCTNCRLDGITCVIRAGKRVRLKPLEPVDGAPGFPPIEISGTNRPPLDDMSTNISPFAAVADKARAPNTPFSSGINPFSNYASNSNLHPDMIYSYFDFLEAETLSHIAPEDFKFLEYKGCFHLPARPILDDLVREYFLHVHPVLPIIDEKAFWEMYFPREGNGKRAMHQKIPLFVFRAMLFVSCGFISDQTVRQLGFQTNVEARTCFYRRAKLLHDFDTTSDLIALSQGALLLTYYSSEREAMSNTSWLRLSIQFANAANVSMYYQDCTLSAEEKLIRKRLWWCIILRDRILPLGVRRCIQITRDNFDFTQSRLSEEDLEPEFRSSCVYDAETKRELAQVFLVQLDLAVELTDTLSHVYPANGFRSFDKLDYNDVMSMPRKMEICQDRLDEWHARFVEWVVPGDWSKKHKSVILYSGLTSIYFQSAKAALYQLESFMLQGDDTRNHDVRMKHLGSALHMSVSSISETVRAFIQLDIAKYLPVSAVAYLALPIILNSIDLQTLSTANTRAEGKRRQLRLLNEAMDLCKDRYTGATVVKNVVTRSIEAARSEKNVIEGNSKSLTRTSSALQDWLDVFISSPVSFLRISFGIDMSLAVGRYPTTEDLPRRLSLHGQLLPSKSIPQSLMPAPENVATDESSVEEATLLEPTRNSYLDYFDLGQSQTESRPSTSPWSGKHVDRILEEVLGGGERFWASDTGST